MEARTVHSFNPVDDIKHIGRVFGMKLNLSGISFIKMIFSFLIKKTLDNWFYHKFTVIIYYLGSDQWSIDFFPKETLYIPNYQSLDIT